MSYKKYGSKRILALLLTFLMILSLVPASAFADGPDEDDYPKKTIEVQFTLSHDDNFVVAEKHGGVSKKPIAREKFELKYFDLKNYGLEKFYFKSKKYNQGDNLVGTPETARNHLTVLHLYIYVAEVYYLGIDPKDVGKGALKEKFGTDLFSYSGSPGSMFFNKIFNFDYNLNYYVNGRYPLASSGWGQPQIK